MEGLRGIDQVAIVGSKGANGLKDCGRQEVVNEEVARLKAIKDGLLKSNTGALPWSLAWMLSRETFPRIGASCLGTLRELVTFLLFLLTPFFIILMYTIKNVPPSTLRLERAQVY